MNVAAKRAVSVHLLATVDKLPSHTQQASADQMNAPRDLKKKKKKKKPLTARRRRNAAELQCLDNACMKHRTCKARRPTSSEKYQPVAPRQVDSPF
jgi:hypothetical protein